MNDYPNELSKTKGSIPERLLSVSVQIWLQMIILRLASLYDETAYYVLKRHEASTFLN
jgi:hypothetical protein